MSHLRYEGHSQSGTIVSQDQEKTAATWRLSGFSKKNPACPHFWLRSFRVCRGCNGQSVVPPAWRGISVEPRTPSRDRTVLPYAHGSSFTSLAVRLDFDRPRKETRVEQGTWGLVPSRLWEGGPRRDQRTPGNGKL